MCGRILIVKPAEEASAVLLHVEPPRPRLTLPFPEMRPEVPVHEAGTLPVGRFLPDLPDQVMPLVRADEEGGGEGIEIPHRRPAGGPFQPHPVTPGAPGVLLLPAFQHILKGPEIIAPILDDHQAFFGGEVSQGIPPGLVFLEGMDVGIIPEESRADSLFSQEGKTALGTGAAAGMEQESHGNSITRQDLEVYARPG